MNSAYTVEIIGRRACVNDGALTGRDGGWQKDDVLRHCALALPVQEDLAVRLELAANRERFMALKSTNFGR